MLPVSKKIKELGRIWLKYQNEYEIIIQILAINGVVIQPNLGPELQL